jgi:hypothetical protein
VIVLLTAAAWRVQGSSVPSGLLVGAAVALKLFVWPLAVWLAAIERKRAVLVAALVAAVSLVFVVPYTGLDDYVASLARVGQAFDQDAYTVYGLVLQAGGPAVLGRVLTAGLGIALLWGTWRYRSFALAVATALLISPIVWLDYFALAAVPLAVARPRFSPVWLVPLATVGLEGAGLAIGDVFDTLRALGAFAVVLAVAFRSEQARRDVTVQAEGGRLSPRRPHRVATHGPREV